MLSRQAEKGVAILGASGQLGRALVRALSSLGPVYALSHAHCDIGDEKTVRDTLQRLRPGVVINAAAYTAVDKAEYEPGLDKAYRTNALGPRFLANVSHSLGAWLVHYSTDYVFNGHKRTPYIETDRVGALNMYGWTKHHGEEAILRRPLTAFVLRTSWLYDREGANFVATIRRIAEGGGPLRVVNDQWGCPTSTQALAEATKALLTHRYADQSKGLYHASCGGAATWYELALAVLEVLGISADIVPITTAEYRTAAKRPLYSVLSCRRLEQSFGIVLPPWKKALEAALREPA